MGTGLYDMPHEINVLRAVLFCVGAVFFFFCVCLCVCAFGCAGVEEGAFKTGVCFVSCAVFFRPLLRMSRDEGVLG